MTAQAQAAQPSLRTTVRDPRHDSRASLLWTLYFHAPLTRQELVRRTGLSATTVRTVIGKLIAEGVVTEGAVTKSLITQDAVTSGTVVKDAATKDAVANGIVTEGVVTEAESALVAVGRRAGARLRLVPEHRYVIGVEVADTRVRVGLFDLALTQRTGVVYPLRSEERDAKTVVGHILTGLDAVIEEAAIPQGHILGVGIGVSATGWNALPLERLLSTGTALPLHIDNGAEAMGRAEMWFGAGRGVQHAVVAVIGSGVSASVITHGAPYRGSTNSAGEWGHTTVQAGGRRCRCGARGCLEAYVGAEAVLERFRQARRGRAIPGVDKESTFAGLLAAADTSPAAQRVLEEAAVYLGAGIANLVNLFNPQRIILGGWAGLLFGARMLPRIRETVAAQALRRPYAQTTIGLCRLGPHAVTLGAATVPVGRFLTEDAHRPARRPATTPQRALTGPPPDRSPTTTPRRALMGTPPTRTPVP
ncbi:ROK family protein [Streptomyces violaceusniger]|uniref:ROK family protein n=1 Tax=Streptomyces violaceusniger (strain Tu 4113) TaxID=653045 RepID=G2PE38_STRV4|nr:ROK family protein [Streptomyces violaceusniger]AEM82866.1 ROK family protein [Streptomyces violaceusniger Tu 4113]